MIFIYNRHWIYGPQYLRPLTVSEDVPHIYLPRMLSGLAFYEKKIEANHVMFAQGRTAEVLVLKHRILENRARKLQ